MKSAIKGLVALLLVLGMAAPALAIDGDLKGYWNIRGIATSNVDDGTNAADDNRMGVDQRMRLWFTGALNENVKGVFAVENDVTWGDEADYGVDIKGDLEIKHSYVQFSLMDATVTAGLQGFSQGRGFVIADDAPGLQIVKKFGGANVALYWIHGVEGDLTDDSQDQDYYSVQADFVAGDFSVVPLIGYIAGPTEDNTVIIFGGSADGKVADIGLALTLLGSSWDDGTNDGMGVVAYGKASMAFGDISTFFEAGYMGDEDADGGQFQAVNTNYDNATGVAASSPYNNFAEVLTGGKFDGRGTVGHQAVSDTSMNWLYAKLGAKAKVDAKSNVEGALIYAAQAVDDNNTVDGSAESITYGFEVDAYYNRTLVEGLVATVGGGYLFADDEFMTDNAYKIGTALTYKF